MSTHRLVEQEDMSSSPTSKHVALLTKRTCPLAQQDYISEIETATTHLFFFNKRTCPLLEPEDIPD